MEFARSHLILNFDNFILYSGELRDAFTKKDAVKFGLYFSLYEWFNPMYLQDKKNEFKTNKFVVVSLKVVLLQGNRNSKINKS